MTSSPPPDDFDGPPTASMRKPLHQGVVLHVDFTLSPAQEYSLYLRVEGTELPYEVRCSQLPRAELVATLFQRIQMHQPGVVFFHSEGNPVPKMLSAKMLELIKTHAIEPGDVLLVAPGKD